MSTPATVLAPPSDELIRRYDTAGPRYTSYPTAPNWTDRFGPDDYRRHLEAASQKGSDEPLSLYVHLPFCKTLCTYCGCNVVISREKSAADEYLAYLDKELSLVTELLGNRRSVAQLHWGGGTPTFLDEQQIQTLFGQLTRRFTLLPDAEVAIEINPATARVAQLELLRSLGFNRVSMGVQDFEPLVQRTINRHQTVEQTQELLAAARRLGFSGVNFDLVYGLPHQTDESWEHTLEAVLAMRPDRFAIYAFAYLPDMLRHQRKLPVSAMLSGGAKLGLLRRAMEAMTAAGYVPIGMDHFALPDDELAVAQKERRLGRNFQGYTVKQAADVVAFGATAIGDVAFAYAQNAKELSTYYAALDAGHLATARGIVLSEEDRQRRQLINQLMCNFHVDLGPDAATRFANELEGLRPFLEDGLVRWDGRQLDVTPQGRFFVRNVAMLFDTYLRGNAEKVRFSKTV